LPYRDKEKLNKWFRDRYQSNIEFVQEYKINKGCTDCGYNEHHAGLEFDHVKPRLRGTVGDQMGKSLKVILEEIERCEVVCGTCHRIREWERRQNEALSSSGKDTRFSPLRAEFNSL
jgi:hypothetical protein